MRWACFTRHPDESGMCYQAFIFRQVWRFFYRACRQVWLLIRYSDKCGSDKCCMFYETFRQEQLFFFIRHSDESRSERRWPDHQWRQDVDHQRYAGWLDVSAGQHQCWPASPEQVAHLPSHGSAWWVSVNLTIWSPGLVCYTTYLICLSAHGFACWVLINLPTAISKLYLVWHTLVHLSSVCPGILLVIFC